MTTDQHRDASCTGKVRYESRETAHRHSEKYGGGLSVYECRYCGDFHNGHVPSLEGLQSLALMLRAERYPELAGVAA